MTKDKWVWMPHAGHLIVGNDCRFRLNTYVGKYIVSTVGEYWPDSQIRKIHAEVRGKTITGRGDEWDANFFKEFGFEEIGCDRKYETMVFKAQKKGGSLCCPYRAVIAEELDFDGYNTPEEAYMGHIKLCLKWSKK